MKFLPLIARNALRNPIRAGLTVASIAISLFLMMILVSFLTINGEVSASLGLHNRLIVMSSQGFAQPVPLALVPQVAELDGVVAASPFGWYGGKLGEESIPFPIFGVDADVIMTIMDEMTVPPEQIQAFREDKAGCLIGRQLAEERGFRVGDRIPLKGTVFPVDLTFNVRGTYDADRNRDRRMCLFHYDYLDDALRDRHEERRAGNAGTIYLKCRNAEVMPTITRKIDEMTQNSDTPTRTQSEEAFGRMFAEMLGDMRLVIGFVGLAVISSLICVAAVAMAMSLRERTTEVAVLKAIGFGRPLVLVLVLAEAILIAGLGGVVGALGAKLLFDLVDLSQFTAGILPFFFVPWPTVLLGLSVSLLIGLSSGFFPALRAAGLPVVDGLRKVV